MNFDSDFGNIYDCLYDGHKGLLMNSEYKVNAKNRAFIKMFNDNYKNVVRHLKYISKEQFYKIFDDAYIFANSIKDNDRLISDLDENGLITKLVFSVSQKTILEQICAVGKDKGLSYVNIEHWTILIYFYFAIQRINHSYYKFPEDNSFIEVIKVGNKYSASITSRDYGEEDVLFNGFSTYLRMLFSIVIFAKGKAVDISKLNKINQIDLKKLKEFLRNFNILASLNYDHLMEKITEREVEHFHGEFVKNKKEYVYHQSFGLHYTNGYASFSDVLIGDYFLFKSVFPVIWNLASKKTHTGKNIEVFGQRSERIIKGNSINAIVIFGMNIENDQHVLRNIMSSFYFAEIQNSNIVYCYFNAQERDDFEKQYDAVITFDEELSRYARNIEVNYIKTQDILNAYFYKSEIVEELLN
ncbi:MULTISPECIES: hypothetical protein [Bacillus cereus group]|uniref:hypothetical protein n=1 Tax=Bacillus cereus group TaxID=86661 RepID=UPI000AD7AA5D|nr:MULTISPECIES: hypothetical protein [Bacillus cereus group]MDG1622861.1 hypothetical protein [Bacillus mobilis]MDX5837226.1 hypothetical protein [Bacillus cereus group sp. BfR-BA-01700]HDR7244379.1 hypothetical protein [Bacillus mobilis]